MKNKKLFVITVLILLFIVSHKYKETLIQKYIHYTKSADIIMFGDSHIANGKWNSKIDKKIVLNFGWSGYTSKMLVNKISLINEFKAKYVFILCGGNDIFNSSFDLKKTVENFKTMHRILEKENIKPVFQKLIYMRNNEEFNLKIDSINRFLTNYCIQENIDIIDIGKKMYNASGLKADFTLDNLHLNEAGYNIWAESINNYLKEN
jgi:lysophospholipase L1-like esterase